MTTSENANMQKLALVFQYTFIGILFAALGTYLVMPYAAEITGWVFWGIFALEIVMIFVIIYFRNQLALYTFTFLTGITLVPIINQFISTGQEMVIFQALVGTAVITGLTTLYAKTTKKNFLQYGPIMFIVLIGLIVVALLNIWIGSSFLQLVIAWIALGLFSFLMIYDVQQILYTDEHPIVGAIGIYLNILNIFTSLLQILGSDDD